MWFYVCTISVSKQILSKSTAFDVGKNKRKLKICSFIIILLINVSRYLQPIIYTFIVNVRLIINSKMFNFKKVIYKMST